MSQTTENSLASAQIDGRLMVGQQRYTPKEARTMAERREKIERLRARGIEPFPRSFADRTEIVELHTRKPEEATRAKIAGRLVARRSHREIVFMDVRDGSGEIEVLCQRDELGDEDFGLIADIDIGDIVGVNGTLAAGRREKFTLKANSLSIMGKALLVPPQRSSEQPRRRSDAQELDMIAGDASREMLRARNALKRFLRRWFDANGFLEVDTPVLTPHASGSAARPFVALGNALNSNLHMRMTMEQPLKRVCIGGFENVYDLGRCFRNEGISKRHHFEFTMLDWLQGYADYHDTMDLIQTVVSGAASEIFGKLQFARAGKTFDLTPPWRRITAREAILRETGTDISSIDRDEMVSMVGSGVEPNADRSGLVGAIYSKLVEPNLIQPTFVIDFPRALFPLARRHRADPELSESFEAVIAGVEISSGTTNLNDPDEQRLRFTEQQARNAVAQDGEGALADMDEDFLRGLAQGMVPVTGAGMGVDRILMLLMERDSLREVIPFPTL